VDVTFDDPVGYEGKRIYHHTYNVGRDRANEFYTWREELEYHRIERISDENWLALEAP